MPVRFGLLGLLSLCLIAATGGGSAAIGPHGQNALLLQEGDVTVPPEVQFLADHLDLSEEQAANRSSDLDALDSINFAEMDDNFVDLRIVPAASLVIDYYTLDDEIPGSVLVALQEVDANGQFNAVQVPRRLDVIRSAMELLASQVAAFADLRVDIRRGAIEATVASAGDVPIGFDTLRGVPIRWVVGPLFEDNVSGGKPWGCTAGFVVINAATLKRGISTAAHCSPPEFEYQGVTVEYVNGHDGGRYGVKWYKKVEPETFNNAVACCGGARSEIVGRESVDDMRVGDPVCKMGKGTGWECAFITDKGVCYNNPQACTYVEIGQEGEDLGEPGDSGGPVYWDRRAYGWHVAGAGRFGLFMPQQYSYDYGFIVATS